MTTEQIHSYRSLAEQHKGNHKSAQIILECLSEIERLQELYCIALEAAYKSFPRKRIAWKRLIDLAET